MSIGRRLLILFSGAVVLVIAVWIVDGKHQFISEIGKNTADARDFPALWDTHTEEREDGVASAVIDEMDPGELDSLDLPGQLHGRAIDMNSGRPVTQFSIGLFANGRLEVSNHPDFDAAFEVPDGNFEISNLEHGRFDILARADNYQPVIQRDVEIGNNSTNVYFRFEAAGRIAGRVINETTGDAVPGARVSALPTTGGPSSRRRIPLPGQLAITDDSGQFELSELPLAEIRLWTRADGYAPSPTDVGSVSSVDIVVALTPAGSVSGRIMDVDGSAVAGGSISLIEKATATSWRRRADKNGDFEVRELPDGVFMLTASSAAGRSEPITITLAAGERLENMVLQILQGNELVGRVSGLMSGEEVRAVTATHSNKPIPSFPYQEQAHVDSMGNYKFGGLPNGEYVARALTNKGRSLARTINLQGSSTTFVDFIFIGPGSVEGQVLLGDQPLRNIEIHFLPADISYPRASTRTTDDGGYRINGLANGEYEMVIWHAERRSIRVNGETRYDFVIE
jgi:hypothetical protein